ncbi:MAG: D-2-hydroxyacid dehydrogenase [Acidimicrobiales bacterium]
MRILLTESAARSYGERLAAVHHDAELVTIGPEGVLALADGTTLERDGTGAEVAWATSDLYDGGSSVIRPFFGLVRRLDGLRWFQSSAAGFEHPVFAELIRRGVLFTKSDVHAIPIAEYVLRAVLDHLQQPERWADAQRRRRWAPHEFAEVASSTWVVVGFGSIGARVADLARALGATVIGVRRHPEPVDGVEMVTPDGLASVLRRADVVVLCAPANASTRHLVDPSFLAAMKPGSLLVNIGRGSIVDEAALVAALDSGPIGAAVLDVFETEPLPRSSPLWHHPQVTVSPHSSGSSIARADRQADLFSENLGRFVSGERLRNLVTESDLD